jgi:hypothetical protein
VALPLLDNSGFDDRIKLSLSDEFDPVCIQNEIRQRRVFLDMKKLFSAF